MIIHVVGEASPENQTLKANDILHLVECMPQRQSANENEYENDFFVGFLVEQHFAVNRWVIWCNLNCVIAYDTAMRQDMEIIRKHGFTRNVRQITEALQEYDWVGFSSLLLISALWVKKNKAILFQCMTLSAETWHCSYAKTL
ncbi:hypothetical protein M514_16300 [Trichuris suis]|uniref:Uncharacterized protein n=1 Tax=Trichuris suis TaxID=68888 RepID=A0A085NPH2_9BILA|nr:hypothetical protein M514_16300 [Trichuris suis]